MAQNVISENEKLEKLKEMLDGIKAAIEEYNSLGPKEEMQVTKKDNIVDVKDVFICVYNGKSVGLFKKTTHSFNHQDRYTYHAVNLYTGIDSNYVGMKEIHWRSWNKSLWMPPGTEVTLDNGKKLPIVNCQMSNGMSFDDMRMIMYGEKSITNYERGKATQEEINEVLQYARKYYGLNNGYERRR